MVSKYKIFCRTRHTNAILFCTKEHYDIHIKLGTNDFPVVYWLGNGITTSQFCIKILGG